ncbi:MAG: hypothetical protein HY321_13875 [Armatimonadetes bacterium]|nr:hypothetical protein [Armatimonadota bacterium]
MSVRDRLLDAKVLWGNDRKEGAWIQVLIAAAATSRERFPDKGDGAAFRQFIREITPEILDSTAAAIPGGITVIFNGDTPHAGPRRNRPAAPDRITVIFNGDTPHALPLHDVMYKHLRCYLVHEAQMPPEVRLSNSRVVDGKLVADLRGGTPLTIPDFWVLHLAKAVADAPENADACTGIFS